MFERSWIAHRSTLPRWLTCASCLNRDPSRYRTLREAVQNIREREKKEKDMKPETHLRLGVGEVLLGRYHSGLEHLKKAGDLGHGLLFPWACAGEPAAVRGGRDLVRRRPQARV